MFSFHETLESQLLDIVTKELAHDLASYEMEPCHSEMQHSEISAHEFELDVCRSHLEELEGSEEIDGLLLDCMWNDDPFSCDLDPFVTFEGGFNLLDYEADSTPPDMFEALAVHTPENREVLTRFVNPSLVIEHPSMMPSPESVHAALVPNIQRSPYIPGNDHCYSQPLGNMQPTNQRIPLSPDEDDSDLSSDVDVETVTEEPQAPRSVIRAIKKPTRGRSQRENVPPRSRVAKPKYRQVPVKRTKQLKMKSVSRTNKRGRRPANSLPNSPSSSRSSSDVDEEPVKRSVHNNMERMRREQQKRALHHLRETIPELSSDCKAPKVKILHKAQQYVKYLESSSRQQQELINKLISKHMLLTKKLERLKRRKC